MTEPGPDRPQENTQADVTLVTRGITVTARVGVSGPTFLVVLPMVGGTEWSSKTVSPGEPVELFWAGEHEERTLPAKISEVEGGTEPRWHLLVTGPATRSQRRRAVRARTELPVVIPWAGAQMIGKSVDVSEAGMRALMDGWGIPPEPGTVVTATVELDGSYLDLRSEIVRQQVRGAQWLLSMRFDDVPEKVGDVLRRKVFQVLREERARADD
jgi:hypothetical protein